MLKILNKKLCTLLGLECLLVAASCIFFLYELYDAWYIRQHPEYEFHKVMALGQYFIGIIVSSGFGIWLLMLVRSFLHFFFGLILVIVQLWISLLFCGTGTYAIDFSLYSGMLLYLIFTLVHIRLALYWMNTLTLRKKVLNGEQVEI